MTGSRAMWNTRKSDACNESFQGKRWISGDSAAVVVLGSAGEPVILLQVPRRGGAAVPAVERPETAACGRARPRRAGPRHRSRNQDPGTSCRPTPPVRFLRPLKDSDP